MKKLKFLFVFICLFACQSLQAQDSRLVIQMKDGSTESYYLADKPKIRFNEKQLEITSLSLATSYDRSTIKNFHFEKTTSDDINTISANELRIICMDKSQVKLIGLSEADLPIQVYDITGCQYPSTIVNSAENSVTISLTKLPTRTYIIKTNRNKFIKIRR